MATQPQQPGAAEFLAMMRKTTSDDIKKICENILMDLDIVEIPNESCDAATRLDENRKPNPEAQEISDMLAAQPYTVRALPQ